MKCHIMSRSLVNTHKKKCTWLSLFTSARFGNTHFTSVRRQMTSLSVHYKKYTFLFVIYWVIIYWDRGKYQPLLPTPRWLIVLEYTTQDGKKKRQNLLCLLQLRYLNNDRYLETLGGELYLCNHLRASCSQSARAKALKYPLCSVIKYI